MKLSVVIPCYNSQNSIKEVVSKVKCVLSDNKLNNYEIICVDDGSGDNTSAVLKQLAFEDRKVKVVLLSKNFGQHAALMAGFNCVTGDIIACMDDDGQNDANDIIKLIDKLNEGYDVVSARYEHEHRSFIRTLGSKVSMTMSHHLIGMPKDIELNSFCVFNRFVCNEVIKYKNPYPFIHGLMLRVTRNIANVVLKRNERAYGNSGYTLRKLVSLWLNGFTAFSVLPLRIASIVGAVASIGGFLFGLITVIRKIMIPTIYAGYSSILATILFFFGLNLLFLGLIGEYLGRTYICINDAPQYVVRSSINTDSKEWANREISNADKD